LENISSWSFSLLLYIELLFKLIQIFSKVLRAGRRTYFFDVRETKASDYYLNSTESKKCTNDDGTFHYTKHKIYLYKEDFTDFSTILAEMVDFIIKERGEEVISERHQKNYNKDKNLDSAGVFGNNFTDLNFEDI
jgi:hypothetical protein